MTKRLHIKTLSKDYQNPYEIMLHACFQVLTDFIEKEDALNFINWESDKGHSFAAKEFRSLYKWWTKTRPNRTDPIDLLPEEKLPKGSVMEQLNFDKSKYPEYWAAVQRTWKLERLWETIDRKNLIRLMKVRMFMWT